MPKTRQRRRKTKQTKKRGGYKSDEEIIEQLTQEYVQKIMSKIRYYYKKQLMFDIFGRNKFIPRNSVPSIFRKDSIDNKQKISFEELKNKLKKEPCKLLAYGLDNRDQHVKQWFDELYSKIATVYINSQNVREFVNNTEMENIREQYLNFVEEYLQSQIKIASENIQTDNKRTINNYYYLNKSLHFNIDYTKQIGKRYFHIKLIFSASILNILTSSSKMMKGDHNNGDCNLFYYDGFKNYEIDDKTKLLSVLNTTAPEVLDADTLSQIRDFT